MSEPRGWYSRGYVLHLDAGCACQFLTWRLDDAVPKHMVDRWKMELESATQEDRKRKLWKLIENYCDAGHGSCLLRSPMAAIIVQDALCFHHGSQYILHEWVVMPNHVHVLLTPKEGISLETILHSQKSFSSSEINKALGRTGRLWQPEAFDRLIRNEGHFDRTAQYIRHNPVKAKLCPDYRRWPYSSANPLNQERLRTILTSE